MVSDKFTKYYWFDYYMYGIHSSNFDHDEPDKNYNHYNFC